MKKLKNHCTAFWSDAKVNPITKISTNGKIDNVYSGTIRLRVVSY